MQFITFALVHSASVCGLAFTMFHFFKCAYGPRTGIAMATFTFGSLLVVPATLLTLAYSRAPPA